MDDEGFGSDNPKDGMYELGCVRLIISGKVQKVGYRNWLKNICMQKKVTGWVRNRSDGTVEAMLYANKSRISDVVNQCYVGPSAASVKKIKEYPGGNTDNAPKEFSIALS